MQQPGANPAMPYAPQFAQPRRSFFRSTGCVTAIVGLIALGLLAAGASRYLKLPSFGNTHHVVGVSDEIVKGSGRLVEAPVDDLAAADLKTMAAKEIGDAFGQDAVNPYGIDTEGVRDKNTDQTTFYAGGSFECLIRKDREHVVWKVGYQRDEQGKWSMVSHEAYYQTDDGVAQFDWDVKKFIHLVR